MSNAQTSVREGEEMSILFKQNAWISIHEGDKNLLFKCQTISTNEGEAETLLSKPWSFLQIDASVCEGGDMEQHAAWLVDKICIAN